MIAMAEMKRICLLFWRVLLANRRQCRMPFWAKAKLVIYEIHHPRSFSAFRGPLKRELSAVERKLRDPAGLEELLKEKFQVGTVAGIAREIHKMRSRDICFDSGGKA